MGIDFVSTNLVCDPVHGVVHPAEAVIWIGPYAFEASEPADWEQALRIAGMSAGTVAIPTTGVPGGAWWAGARRLARLVLCSCGDAHLDPASEGFDCRLCAACYEAAGWENAHSDYDHDRSPDPDCPICKEVVSGGG